MSTKNALIVDDEAKSRTAVRSLLTKYCPEVHIVGEAEGVASGLEAIAEHRPDVLFLDIEMNDGTGFDLIEKRPYPAIEVIFVTAYNQYAIQAFRYSAIDYLLKPINPNELMQAVRKLAERSRINEIEKRLDTLMENQNSIQKIAVPVSDGLRIEQVANIRYCESDNYYTTLFLHSGERLLVCKTLKEYDQMLSPEGFIRIHQKYLVKVSEIKSYSRSDGGFVTLNDGTHLTVSRRKKDELMQVLKGSI